SLGRFQDAQHHSPLTTHYSPFDLVRRPTGGRAVLHQHEITYAVAIGEELLPPGARSVIGAYRWLSAGFIAGLEQLGVAATLARANPPAHQRATNCFAAASQCDFLVDDRKLIGAAQCRKQGVILQHGSILLDIDHAAWEATVGGSMADAITLKSLGVTASREDIIAALCAGVERILHASLRPGTLDAPEMALAQRLRCEKYTRPTWNRQGIPS
ncbi:MAG: hypothetical protein M3347_03040, partial [Armatimonadota bacterium]|nr:hypothetical protein [Armatimonadota bacterium]